MENIENDVPDKFINSEWVHIHQGIKIKLAIT